MESRKHAASLPRPPFPSAASCSCAMISSMRKPSSESPSKGSRGVRKRASKNKMRGSSKIALTFSNILQPHIQHSIIQRPAHQKLQTQIVDPLGIRKSLPLLRTVPLSDQAIPERQTSSRIRRRLVAIEHATRECGFDMAHDFFLEIVLCDKGFGLEFLPCFALGLGDRCCWEARRMSAVTVPTHHFVKMPF